MATYRVRDCSFCGKQFQPNASHSRHCSPVCRFKSIAARFSGAECWQWPLSRNPRTGYGQFTLKPVPAQILVTAHRMSYETFVGDIPDGFCVMHKCDNRACFNPDHLAVGTLADNNRDMFAKGRDAWANHKPVTRCLRGHEKRLRPNGQMRCPVCARAQKGQTTSRNRT